MSFQLQPSIGKDPTIRDLSRSSIPSWPPHGYMPLGKNETTSEIGAAARQILRTSELGDQVPFTIDGQQYIGRSEPHYHEPPPVGTDPSEYSKYPKPWGWHRGVSVFRAKEGTQIPASENYQPSSSSTTGRMRMLQRIDDFYSSLDK